MTAKLLAFAAAAALCYSTVDYMKDPVPPLYEIRALTLDGHMYVLGSGDTCKDAMVGVKVWRDSWARVACEAAS